MPIPSQRAFDALHNRNLEKYTRQLRKLYLEVIREVAKLAVPLSLNAKNAFYFRNYSRVNEKVNKLLKSLYTEVYGSTVSGIHSEWDLAVNKNNELTNYVFGKDLDKLPVYYRTKYLSNNDAARRNFVFRKDNGLGLSDKIWNNTRQLKAELELALELGIGKGKSAESMATSVTRYLNDPEKLFRRVRSKPDGPLRLSKAAKAYNPGQGRYRSSYKNAFRLTRNETNFSYQASQQEKIKQQDFIVGIKIRTSPQHNPASDKGGISCISLQGRYPKDFDWTYKWHVNCICLSLNILKTRTELDQDTTNILSGGEPNTPSKNQVSKTPGNYNNYVKNNTKKWANWKNQPRFVVSN